VCVCVCADEALSRCELTKAELEMEMSKVRMEAAGLRDALLKVQNLNEGLGQDKDDLNKLIIQVVSSQYQRTYLYLTSDIALDIMLSRAMILRHGPC